MHYFYQIINVIIGLLSISIGFAQSPKKGAVQNSDTLSKQEKFEYLFTEGKKLVTDNPERAITLLTQAIDFAGNDSTLINTYKALSNAYKNTNNYEKAFLYLTIAKDIASRSKNNLQLAWLTYETGLLYHALEDYQESIKQFENAYSLSKNYDDVLKGVCLTQIGVCYRHLKDYWRSLRYINLAEGVFIQKKDTAALIGNYHNKALVFTYFNKTDSALWYFRKNLILSEQLGRFNFIIGSYSRIGTAFERAGQFDSAMHYYQKAVALNNNKESSPRWITDAYQNMARICLKRKQVSQAQEYAKIAEKLSLTMTDKTYLSNSYYLLAECHDSSKQYKDALFYMKLADSMRSKLLDYKNLQYINSLNYKYETAKKQTEAVRKQLVLEEARLQVQKQRTNVLWILVFLLVLVVGFIWIIVIKKNKTTQQLTEQNKTILNINKKLQELNLEKNNLISIVAHDIRAPLQRIKGILSIMQMTNDNLTDEQKDLLNQAIKITEQSNEMVTELLYVNSLEEKTENLILRPVNLVDVLQELSESYKEQAQSKAISLEFEHKEKEIMILAETLYVNRIFDNLISNAIKFSHSGSNVRIYAQTKGRHAYASVRDEGQGIAPEDRERLFQKFQRLSAKPTAGENSTGLGLAIVKRLTEKLGASIEVDSSVGKGTTFTVIFKLV